MTNLILGHCARQQPRHLEPFLASLRRIAFVGDVCLFVEDIVADAVAHLRAYGVIVCRAAPSGPPSMTAGTSRYFNFLARLADHVSDYTSVMLVDPADTIFQSDPFAVPRLAELVFTQERRRIVDSPGDHSAVVAGYGETMARNIRDFLVSNPSTTIASASGMLRYLTAITAEIGGRNSTIAGAFDRGAHNYLVRMRPLRDAWVDRDDRFAVAVDGVPNDAIAVTGQDILVDGRAVPVLTRWHGNPRIHAHVADSPRFRLDDAKRGAFQAAAPVPPAPRLAPARNTVLAFCQKGRDEAWLPLFIKSLRCVAPEVIVHCVGDFSEPDHERLTRAGFTIHMAPPVALELCDNTAHVQLSGVLEQLAADTATQLDQVLVLDTMRAIFPRDPFATRTIGLSVFCEGHDRIVDSAYNRTRLAYYVPESESGLPLPVVSSSALRGRIPVVRAFYQNLFTELMTRPDVLSVAKVVQGVFNKLCHLERLAFPVVVHPNGAEVYFDFWETGLPIDTRHGFRVGGTVPGVVLGSHSQTKLMVRLRTDLGLTQD